jgi:hypothetical protein
VGRYLDPFIDGEVEQSRYTSASEGLFMSRLKAAWNDPHVSPQESQMRAAHGGPESCPVTAGVALVAYVRHCITKMNTNLGFSLHIPGMGRQPVPMAEQEKHALLLGNALVEAIARDFAPDQRTVAVSAAPIALCCLCRRLPAQPPESANPLDSTIAQKALLSPLQRPHAMSPQPCTSRPSCLAMSHKSRPPTSLASSPRRRNWQSLRSW